MNCNIFISFLMFIIIAAVSPGKASPEQNDLSFDIITDEQGLSNNNVNAILQDYQGFMWFGTSEGLNRYDGNTFKIYRNIPGDSTSLSNNFITALLEDSDNRLWIGTWGGGLELFDRENNRFYHFRHPLKSKASLENTISTLFEDSRKRLWVGTRYGGLIMREYKKQEWKTFLPNDADYYHSIGNLKVNAICEDSDGAIWVATDNGTSRIDPVNSKIITYYDNKPYPAEVNSNDIPEKLTCIMSMCLDSRNNLWLGTYKNGYLNRYNRSTGKFQWYNPRINREDYYQNNAIYSILEDTRGKLWIGRRGAGLDRFDPATGEFENYSNSINNSKSLSHNSVLVIYQNKKKDDNILWIGTEGGGVNKVDLNKKQFRLYQKKLGDDKSLNNNEIKSFCETRDGKVWVGTYGGGINIYDPQTGDISFLTHDASAGSKEEFQSKLNSILELTEKGEIEYALKQFSEILSFAPRNGQIHFMHAKLLMAKQRFEDALQALEKANMYEYDPEINFLTAKVLYMLGRRDDAVLCLQSLSDLSPEWKQRCKELESTGQTGFKAPLK